MPEKLFLLRGFHRTGCQLAYVFDSANKPNTLRVLHYIVSIYMVLILGSGERRTDLVQRGAI